MKDKIQKIIDDYPKLFSQIIKRDDTLMKFINNNSHIETDNLSEKIYSIINDVSSNVCKYGNNKKFKSFRDGYKGCGPTKVCKCARKSVSASVSLAKQQYTSDKINAINTKREKTNLKRYGVINIGQTEKALAAHKQFYDDASNVQEFTSKLKQTIKKRYGVENARHIPGVNEKIRKTCLKRYGVDNPWNITEDKQNPMISYLKDKAELAKLMKTKSIPEIVEFTGVHIQTLYRYLKIHKLREPYKSLEEQEVVNFIKSLGIKNIVTNTRKIISKELDIYLPDHNVAIEYNGIYWHHEDIPHIDKMYHYDKFKECQDKGIQLITIFSSQWKSKQSIVKNILKHKLGLKTNKIYARNTLVKSVDVRDANAFLDRHHIQGKTQSSIRMGLYSQTDELVALMTFSKKRQGIGKQRDDTSYELVRFCTKGHVVGGASKLLHHFTKEYSPTELISYSSNEYSDGNLYKKLGFDLERDCSPGYWYVRPREEKLLHRYNYAKHRLVEMGYDSNKTEKEITKEMGLLKIWDCGKKCFIKSNS